MILNQEPLPFSNVLLWNLFEWDLTLLNKIFWFSADLFEKNDFPCSCIKVTFIALALIYFIIPPLEFYFELIEFMILLS